MYRRLLATAPTNRISSWSCQAVPRCNERVATSHGSLLTVGDFFLRTPHACHHGTRNANPLDIHTNMHKHSHCRQRSIKPMMNLTLPAAQEDIWPELPGRWAHQSEYSVISTHCTQCDPCIIFINI